MVGQEEFVTVGYQSISRLHEIPLFFFVKCSLY
jgi:hypothetical protein